MSRRERPAARLILLDSRERLLLFRFDAPDRPPFWIMPGGALDPGETHEEAARRELFEETGIVAEPGPEFERRRVEFITIEGEPVTADERFFVVRVDAPEIVDSGYTALERSVITEHRWWTREQLAASSENIFPEDVVDLLDRIPLAR